MAAEVPAQQVPARPAVSTAQYAAPYPYPQDRPVQAPSMPLMPPPYPYFQQQGPVIVYLPPGAMPPSLQVWPGGPQYYTPPSQDQQPWPLGTQQESAQNGRRSKGLLPWPEELMEQEEATRRSADVNGPKGLFRAPQTLTPRPITGPTAPQSVAARPTTPAPIPQRTAPVAASNMTSRGGLFGKPSWSTGFAQQPTAAPIRSTNTASSSPPSLSHGGLFGRPGWTSSPSDQAKVGQTPTPASNNPTYADSSPAPEPRYLTPPAPPVAQPAARPQYSEPNSSGLVSKPSVPKAQPTPAPAPSALAIAPPQPTPAPAVAAEPAKIAQAEPLSDASESSESPTLAPPEPESPQMAAVEAPAEEATIESAATAEVSPPAAEAAPKLADNSDAAPDKPAASEEANAEAASAAKAATPRSNEPASEEGLATNRIPLVNPVVSPNEPASPLPKLAPRRNPIRGASELISNRFVNPYR